MSPRVGLQRRMRLESNFALMCGFKIGSLFQHTLVKRSSCGTYYSDAMGFVRSGVRFMSLELCLDELGECVEVFAMPRALTPRELA